MDDTRARAPLELASSTALDRVDEGGGPRIRLTLAFGSGHGRSPSAIGFMRVA